MRVNVELRSYQLHISDISKKRFDVSLQLLKEKFVMEGFYSNVWYKHEAGKYGIKELSILHFRNFYMNQEVDNAR